ncbi:MAG: sensor histidine kinase [Betaproteobacteria bacterium]
MGDGAMTFGSAMTEAVMRSGRKLYWPRLVSRWLFPSTFADLDQFRLAWSRLGSLIGIAMIMSGAALDYLIYPDLFGPFLLARCAVSALTLAVFIVLWLPLSRAWVDGLTLFWLSLPQVMIAAMIFATDGARSIYFVGLTLALYPIGVLLPIRPIECVAFAAFTFALYVVACVGQGQLGSHLAVFGANCIFLFFSALLSILCSVLTEDARLRLFAAQKEVIEKNRSLQRTNQALAEVKGHMIEQEKMAALGTLSAGLLHEVNNPVNYSLMALKMALAEPVVRTHPLLLESLTDAQDDMSRVQRIVSDLKTFAYQRPGADNDRAFPLERALRSARRLAAFELKDIEVAVEMPADSEVRGDEPALIGVFINLLSNAAHALHSAARAAPRIDVRARLEGERLAVAVRDNGVGIAPENLSRVFEPFFTTRDVGQGLGLGLAVSFAIVQRHGSRLQVASETDAWTEFSFDLPRATAQPAA